MLNGCSLVLRVDAFVLSFPLLLRLKVLVKVLFDELETALTDSRTFSLKRHWRIKIAKPCSVVNSAKRYWNTRFDEALPVSMRAPNSHERPSSVNIDTTARSSRMREDDESSFWFRRLLEAWCRTRITMKKRIMLINTQSASGARKAPIRTDLVLIQQLFEISFRAEPYHAWRTELVARGLSSGWLGGGGGGGGDEDDVGGNR